MKHLFLTISVATLCLFANAQYGPCATITATTFAMNPQIYTVNYYGVTITLDQWYDQEITVSGNLYPTDAPDHTTPFSITIPANTTTYSTSDMYYQTTPVYDDAGVTITSISPSTVTTGGVSYSSQCVLTGYPPIATVINSNNSMESSGSFHNSALNSIIPTMNFSTATEGWIFQASETYVANQGDDTTGMAAQYLSMKAKGFWSITSTYDAGNPDSVIDIMYDSAWITLTDKNYLLEMVYIVDSVITSDGVEPSTTLYNGVCTSLINLETAINGDNSLSSSDKQSLLSASSILRFSGAYWGSYIENGGTIGYVPAPFSNKAAAEMLAYNQGTPDALLTAAGGPSADMDFSGIDFGYRSSAGRSWSVHSQIVWPPWKKLFKKDFLSFLAMFVWIFASNGHSFNPAVHSGLNSGISGSIGAALGL